MASYRGFRWLLRIMLMQSVVQAISLYIIAPITVGANSLALFDFTYYYVGALTLRLNPHANIYDPRVMPAVASAYHIPLSLSPGPFNYPLLLPIALIPLSLFSFQTASVIWYLFNLLLWALNIALLIDWACHGLLGAQGAEASPKSHESPMRGALARWRSLPDTARFAIVLVIYLGLTYMPLIDAQILGQASMLMLTCFLLAQWFERRGRPEIAGVLLIIPTFIKVFPVFLIAYYVVRGRWRVAVGAAIGGAVALVGMALVVGVGGILSMRGVLQASSAGVFQTFHNESLARVPLWIAVELGGAPSATTAALGDALIALVALGIAAVWFATWRRARYEQGHERGDAAHLDYAWALSGMILITPVTWNHYDIWLLPGIVFGLGYALRRLNHLRAERDAHTASRAWPWVIAALGLFAALLLTGSNLPLGYDGVPTLSPGPYLLGHLLRPFFMLARPLGALLVWLIIGAMYVRLPPVAQPAAVSATEVAVGADGSGVSWRLMYPLALGALVGPTIVRLLFDVLATMASATPK
ncbi:MAG TPA: glycosyltransferase family 87 protein [Ktedonobacterales bacterium]